MKNMISRYKVPVFHYLLGGLVPALVLGLIGGAIIESLFSGMPVTGQILRVVVIVFAAHWGAKFSARRLAKQGIVSSNPAGDAKRAAIIYGVIHVVLLAILVRSGIASSGATVLLTYFWIMVAGNVIATWVFYRRSKKYLRADAPVPQM